MAAGGDGEEKKQTPTPNTALMPADSPFFRPSMTFEAAGRSKNYYLSPKTGSCVWPRAVLLIVEEQVTGQCP